jgi:glycosyltransferase involved in cell wall biosynthesis
MVTGFLSELSFGLRILSRKDCSMKSLKVSVIIPTYNGAKFLGETIQSVLSQTYPNFELVMVNDASPDNTSEIVAQFNDPRIKYLVHEVNKGQDEARLLAIRESSGEILALLDHDDLFHPEKLESHVKLLEKNPDIGFTYNARFELNHSLGTIREVWRPPTKLTLADCVLGFPISPSEMVMRREWAPYLDLSQDYRMLNGGEYLITGRLLMSGCRFAGIDHALNYRRYFSERVHSNLRARCESELTAQGKIISDSRCPVDVIALRDEAFMRTYVYWGVQALIQEETLLGQEFLREAARLIPAILNGARSDLMDFLLSSVTADENLNHEAVLKKIIEQLPEEFTELSNQYSLIVSRGYVHKGTRAIIWDRDEDGARHFEQAARFDIQFDDTLVNQLTRYLLDYSIEFGDDATQNKVKRLNPHFEKIGGRVGVRQFRGCYLINRAFYDRQAGEHAKVPKNIMLGVVENPKNITNRGVQSVFLRSILHK